MPVCSGFARVFLVGLFRGAFGLFVGRRFSVGHGYFGLSRSRRFDCWQGHRQHESRDCQNENEFLHTVKRLNTTQLELSIFRGEGMLLLLRRDGNATSSLSGTQRSSQPTPRVHHPWPPQRDSDLLSITPRPRGQFGSLQQNRIPVQSQCRCNVVIIKALRMHDQQDYPVSGTRNQFRPKPVEGSDVSCVGSSGCKRYSGVYHSPFWSSKHR
jgi:hypothetical protein